MSLKIFIFQWCDVFLNISNTGGKKNSLCSYLFGIFCQSENDTQNLVSIGEGNWELVSCTISRENDCARPESQLRMWHYCQKKSVDSRHFKHTSKSLDLFLLLWSAMFFIKYVRPGLISFVDKKKFINVF